MRKPWLLIPVLILLGFGAIWLRASPDQLPIAKEPSQQSDVAPVPDVVSHATTIHSIGVVALSPSIATAGANQPITVTAVISDPAVIATSVDLIYLPPGKPSIVIGALHDDGLNGDVTAGDNTYTLVFTVPSSSSGEFDFEVSAIFRGALLRVKTNPIPLFVNPAPNISTLGFTVLSDFGGLFTISVPSNWGMRVVQASAPDPYTTESDQFVFPDGTVLFTILIYTPSQWQDISTGGIIPTFLGSSTKYFFGLSEEQDIEDTSNVSATQILSQLQNIYSTFKVTQ